jgi:hypothetical protein
MPKMLGVEILREFLQTVFASAHVKNSPCAVSALLVARAGFGKTTIASGLAPKNTVCVFDATGRGITKLLQENKELHHIIFNDLVAVMSHKASVNALTLSTINAMTEEGLATEAYPTEIKNLGRKCGVIASITPEILNDGRRWWNATGLSSRLVPFSYTHSLDLQFLINSGIKDRIKYEECQLRLPSIPMNVTVPQEMAEGIMNRAYYKGQDLGEEPIYRRHKQYQAMAMGHALVTSDSWKTATVSKKSLDFLDRIFQYVHYTRCAPL